MPRQADRSGAAAAESVVDELHARKLHLVSQLRSVGYWQRLVRARTDLVVAGLLYGAPSPTPGAPAWAPAGARPPQDTLDLNDLTAPPEGLDLDHLLDATAGPGHDRAGTGAGLDRLRDSATLLVRHSRALREELDEVTAALHQHLADDGAAGSPPLSLAPLPH